MIPKYICTAIALMASYPLLAQQNTGSRRLEIAAAAAGVVRQADIARQAIAHHDTTAAQDHVNQALTLTGKIQDMAGTSTQPLIVPISSEFNSESMMVPAKRRANRLKHNASVSEVTGDYTATSLNVSTAREQLQAAQTALNSGDLNAADADLAAVAAAVTTKSFSGDMPLVQARENLAIARTRVLDAKYKDAILPLKSAARALDRFAQKNPGPQYADQAERLRIDIDAYAERITHDHADALGRITGWQNQVTEWFNSGMAQ